jgi:hypothetical protein
MPLSNADHQGSKCEAACTRALRRPAPRQGGMAGSGTRQGLCDFRIQYSLWVEDQATSRPPIGFRHLRERTDYFVVPFGSDVHDG